MNQLRAGPLIIKPKGLALTVAIALAAAEWSFYTGRMNLMWTFVALLVASTCALLQLSSGRSDKTALKNCQSLLFFGSLLFFIGASPTFHTLPSIEGVFVSIALWALYDESAKVMGNNTVERTWALPSVFGLWLLDRQLTEAVIMRASTISIPTMLLNTVVILACMYALVAAIRAPFADRGENHGGEQLA